MSTYAVTGGAGFIGSHIVERLIKDGHKVRVIDDLSTGYIKNLSNCINDIYFLQKDITEIGPMELAEFFGGVDYILHQAAIPSVPKSILDPIATNKVIVEGTLSVLLAAYRAKVKRVIYASSSSVYGNTDFFRAGEFAPLEPLSPYAVAKLVGEWYAKLFANIYGLEAICLRYFNVFGPRQDPNSPYAAAIPKFIVALRQGRAPIVYGNGEQTRDFTYVTNVVDANLLACRRKATDFQAFNIGYGTRTTINQIIEMLNKILKTKIKPEYTNKRVGDVLHSRAHIEKARRALGYEPTVGIEEGLKKTCDYWTTEVTNSYWVEDSIKQKK